MPLQWCYRGWNTLVYLYITIQYVFTYNGSSPQVTDNFFIKHRRRTSPPQKVQDSNPRFTTFSHTRTSTTKVLRAAGGETRNENRGKSDRALLLEIQLSFVVNSFPANGLQKGAWAVSRCLCPGIRCN